MFINVKYVLDNFYMLYGVNEFYYFSHFGLFYSCILFCIQGLSQKVVDICYNTSLCIKNSMKFV